MWEALNQLDISLFLWLNGRNAPWLDPIMLWVTGRNHWFPLYALLIGWLIYTYRKKAVLLIVTLAASVAVGDQLASSVFKPLFLRLRPCHELAVQKLIHPILDCGGQYGFVSSHAATTFALATSIWFLIGRQYPVVKWFFLWAALVSYSRIYVGAHYPLDVLAGAGVGVLSAAGCVLAYQQLHRRYLRPDRQTTTPTQLR